MSTWSPVTDHYHEATHSDSEGGCFLFLPRLCFSTLSGRRKDQSDPISEKSRELVGRSKHETHSQCKFWAMHRLHGKGTSGSGPGTHRILWERHCEPARTVKPSSAHVADLHEWMAQEPTRLGRSDDGPLQLLAAVAAPYCPPCVTASGAAASCGRRRILEQLILLGELVVLLLVLLRVKVLVLFHDAAAITVLLLHRFPGYCTSLFSSSFAAFKIRSLNSEMPVDRTVT